MQDRKIKVDEEELVGLGLSEIVEDIGAFLHFLREKTDFKANETYQKLPTFWMLIPNSIDVDWREGVEDFKLEKEIFSRVVWIISRPVSEEEREGRRAHLLNLFSNIIARDQAKQVVTFLKFLKKEDLDQIRHEYLDFKKGLGEV